MDVTDMRDEYVQIAETAMYALSMAQIPGRFLIDFLPFLRYVPSWFPGASFKRFAEHYKPIVDKMIDRPFDAVKKEMVRSSWEWHANPCLMKTFRALDWLDPP